MVTSLHVKQYDHELKNCPSRTKNMEHGTYLHGHEQIYLPIEIAHENLKIKVTKARYK